MKTDLMIVPTDSLVLNGVGNLAGFDAHNIDLRIPPGLGVFREMIRRLYLSSTCEEGIEAFERGCATCRAHGRCHGEAVVGDRGGGTEDAELRLGPPLLARVVAGRVEPLYPAPDDLVVDERHKDFIFAQPAFLEPLRGDFVKHGLSGLRLLVPTSRRANAARLGAYLTRKGVRAWAERKTERLAEGEHYVVPRKLFEIEQHNDDGPSWHIRFRPAAGFVVSVEIPEGRPPLAVPATVLLGKHQQTVRVEEVQIPPTDLKLKPARRWRLCVLSAMRSGAAGLPSWIEENERTTLPPYPAGGKLFAVACRCPGRVGAGAEAAHGSAQGPKIIPTGTTYFIEFNEPVRVESSAWILAGGY